MTVPRRIVKDTTYLVSRRCARREFLLKPSPLVTPILRFVLAVAAARHRLEIHAACVMSNHYHLVVTDRGANLPAFSQLLDGVIAKALNALYGRWENFWAPGSYSAVVLVTPEDVVEKIAYTLANPASADLVERGRQWPGLWSDPRSIGCPGEHVERPGHYFAEGGSSMRPSEELVFSVPPGFPSVEDFRRKILARVNELERSAALRRGARGVAAMGVRRVLKQRHTDRPAGGEPRRGLNPRVAARDRWKRVEALGRIADFLERHSAALVKYCSGETSVVFPLGTYLMRVRFGASCSSS